MTSVSMEMERLCVLSVAVLLLREGSVCGAAAPGVSGGAGGAGGGAAGGAGGGGGAGVPRQRSRRSWVWNQFFILEEFTGDEPLYVGKLHSDLDKGDGQVRYVLSGDGAASVFTLDEATGDIHASRRLDREQQPFYRLRAQARDRGTGLPLEPETHFTIKVQDVNDNQPQFLHGPYSARVPESAPIGTSVLTVVASDADDPTYGNSARLVYSILQGQPYFSVEPKTGVVRTAHLGLDREVQDQYLVVVQAKDMVGQMGGLSGTTSITVTLTDVNDNPPHFPRKSYRVTVPESAAVSSVVARIKAVDLDQGLNAEMDYRVLDGDGPGTFRVLTDPLTQEGLVVLHKALDFETKSSFTLRVEASNRYVDTRFLSAGPFSDVATVLLLVEDVDEAPVFSSAVSHMEVSEAAAVGTDVGSVSARDPDRTESPVSFSIEQRSDQQRFFTIDSRSGLIRTNRPLDRETSASHNITVLATESLDPSQVGKAVVLVSVTDVNDNAPTFATEYQLLVCEDSRPGQIIETLSAVDRDEPEDGHHFLFSLAAEAAGNLNFTLRDNKDNTVSVLSGGGGFHGFQQQDQWLHLLTVVISDGDRPSLSSTNTLSVAVCDCDRHGRRRSCGRRPPSSLLLAVGLNAAAVVLTCVLTLLGVVMVTVAVRHRRRRWGASPRTDDDDYEREIRENIVRYDDEGGGEEDTEAFDMSALRQNQNQDQNQDQNQNQNQNQNQLLQDFIRDRLAEADLDLDLMAPPFDSLQTFAFEGSSSRSSTATAAASLCSLTSLESEEQNYDFLRDWGPKFRRLADLYGDREGQGRP